MSGRVRRITEVIRQHDQKLFAHASGERVLILRKGDRLAASDYNQSTPDLARLNPQLVLALTHNWKVDGQPVEWGLDPLMRQLQSMDSWADPDMFRNMVKKRERDSADKERSGQNEFRARAADMRSEFARATNDINTASLAKLDRRREKDGYC